MMHRTASFAFNQTAVICCATCLLMLGAANVRAVEVSGYVEGIWTAAQSPYVVVGDLEIQAGDSLIVEPGVQIRFNGHYTFTCKGTLFAVADEAHPILFTRNLPNDACRWGGLRIENLTARAMLRYCTIEWVDNSTQPQPYYFGALYLLGSCWADVRCCTLRHNRAQYGAGIAVYVSAVPAFERLLIYDNTATVQGGGYYTNSGHPVTILNCVFHGNTAPQGGAIWLQNSMWTGVRNSVVWNCGSDPIAYVGRDPKVNYCDVEGGYAGEGNLDLEPQFVNAPGGNFHLGPLSPCRDTGDPAWVCNDPDATRNDMGAYGGPLGLMDIPYPGVRFSEVGAQFQLANGGSQSWGDFNNDGWDDLATGGCLYRNDGGAGFSNVTASAFGGAGIADGVWGDYDNDGYLDYYHIGYTCTLWRNRGDETFEDVTATAGVRPDTLIGGEAFRSDTATWLDIENDGDLDLWVLGSGNFDVLVWPDYLYRNNGDDTFSDISEQSGIRDNYDYDAHGRNIATCDYDQDGDTDVYVGNYWLYPNYHYRNNGDGTFTDIGQITGTAGILDWAGDWRPYFGHTIGCFWSDLNLDGHEDLLVSNLAHPQYLWFSDVSCLYINPATPTCEEPWPDVRAHSGIRYEETHSAVVAADFDNDRDSDIYYTCVYAGRRSYFYEQTAPLNFTENTEVAGVYMGDGWGASLVDWDNDGLLDMSARSGASSYLLMYRNVTPQAGHWIKVRLQGVESNSFGVGARLWALVDGVPLVREIRTAHGTNTSTHGLWAFFGLGDAARVPILRIHWPSGLEEEYLDLAADQTYTFREGEGGPVMSAPDDAEAQPGMTVLSPNPARGGAIHFALSEGTRVRLELFDLAGRRVRTLLDGFQAAGAHSVPVAARGLSAGVYFYRLTTPAGGYVSRCVVMR